MSKTVKAVIGIVLAAIIALLGVDVTIRLTHDNQGELTTKIEVVDSNAIVEEAPTPEPVEIEESILETDEGEIKVEDIKTVENVDSNFACPEGEEECGQGRYVYAPTDTAAIFSNYVMNKCWDVDGAYGSQCWDLGALFWMNYTKDGRTLSTCGTGAAKGAWDCKEQNAGDEFLLVLDPTQLRPGDWVIFNNGVYGHVGMALGSYNNGYIALLGTNQGGYACAGGGSAANVINISLKSFAGAFRPKTYIPPEPEPTPTPAPAESCDRIEVKKGDTLGKIMLRCEGKVEWGEAMNAYARSWKSTKYMLYPTVYDGWISEGGYGLFAGDVIERIK